MDTTFFDRENDSKYYYRRANHRVLILKLTNLVDTETQATPNIYCTMKKRTTHRLTGRLLPTTQATYTAPPMSKATLSVIEYLL